jgi:hypothetical protein
MSRAWRLLLALAALPAVLELNAFRSAAHAQTETGFVATLRGNKEVPPVVTTTTGSARVNFNPTFTRASFQLTVNDGKKVIQAHIHCNVVGMNGPIILFLGGAHPPGSGWNVNGEWIDNATLTNSNILDTTCGSTLPAIARAMENGRAYVNVHTVAHPAGEVRGQLRTTP